ncbi:MAG TPA: squalene/phytoene synthase family protein [Beijerinckiaceae bacterium]|jgi:phytoene synthase
MDVRRGEATSGGKTAADESFPVASLVLARRHRAAVMAFYRLVRLADDIADAPHLAPDTKLARLDALAAALNGNATGAPTEAAALLAVEEAHGCGRAEALVMLDAFRQDAVKRRYESFDALLDYCARSADPVGRFLLRLHGEGEAAGPASDALCTALQILNHLQDLGPDRAALDRVYLPQSFIDRAGGEAIFFAPDNAAGRRPVLDAVLDRVDGLVDRARALPALIQDRRLAVQAGATVAVAAAHARRLRRLDSIAARISPLGSDVARAFAGALARVALGRPATDRAVTLAIVRRSGSSFRLGMSHLVPERRRAIHAVYAFCRVADDIADGAQPPDEKLRCLDRWRAALAGQGPEAHSPIRRELAFAETRFRLPREELFALLDGMACDAADRVRLADDEALDRYARQVAGSVGVLSVHVFGAPEAEDFALSLGRTLQLVNVLRDVDEDASLERVYLPLSRLSALGLEDRPALALVRDPRFARACAALAREAEAGFAEADRMLQNLDRATLKPAVLMMEGYRRLLNRLIARGFAERGPRLRLKAVDRLQLLRHAVGAA